MFNPLMQKVVSAIAPAESVVELGSQTWIGPKGKTSAEEFYRLMGWKRYQAIDIDGQWGALRLDINEMDQENVLEELGTFDLVTNNGTGEHLFNQDRVFRLAHALCKPGGLMVHVLPWTGWLNHGFFSFHPILFRDLAMANGYEIAALYAGERDGRLLRLDVEGADPYHHPKSRERSPILKTVHSFGMDSNVSLIAVMHKRTDAPFKVPTQGKYAETMHEFKQMRPMVLRGEVNPEPFPHLVMRDALDAELYRRLEAGWPEWQWIAGNADDPTFGNVLMQKNTHELLGAKIPALWKQFVLAHTSGDWLQAQMTLFDPWLAPIMEKLPRDVTVGVRGTGRFDLSMDTQLAINTPVRKTSRVRGPHVDSPDEIFGGLLYMPMPGDDAGGDLILYEVDDDAKLYGKAEVPEHHARESVRIPYEPNTLVLFLNGPKAVHGVAQRKETPLPRRYVNFVVCASKPVIELPQHGESDDQSLLRTVHMR